MTTTVRVNGDRLLARLEALAEFGAIEGGGSCRLALTDEDTAGRDLVGSWSRDHDLDVRIGYLGAHPCPGPPPHAYVELHIEQGPVLEDRGIDIGVVEGVQGISWQELVIVGQSNHAGTTPMALRHDAGYAAAAVATFVR